MKFRVLAKIRKDTNALALLEQVARTLSDPANVDFSARVESETISAAFANIDAESYGAAEHDLVRALVSNGLSPVSLTTAKH